MEKINLSVERSFFGFDNSNDQSCKTGIRAFYSSLCDNRVPGCIVDGVSYKRFAVGIARDVI